MSATGVFIVTIDGPAGVGKTTLAKRLAGKLGIAYLDTGAMFRFCSLYLGDRSWERPEDEIEARLESVVFNLHGSGAETVLNANGKAIGDEIRTEEVGMWASNIGKIPAVRAFLKAAQQALGRTTSMVAEGRDMGTVVFPEASCKFFLDASPRVRAERRYKQLLAMGKDADIGTIEADITARDEQDRNRTVAPLKPAQDAQIIDTDGLDIEGVFRVLSEFIDRKGLHS